MKDRLEYIDSLKGFAILLVVMGHMIAWNFSTIETIPSFENIQSMSPTPILLWKIIYSFHMPLFILISGYLFGFSHFKSFKDYLKKLYSKALMLLIPWIICGALLYLWRGSGLWNYWYLLILFILIAIVGFEIFLIDKVKSKRLQIITEIFLLICTRLVIHVIPHFINNPYLNALGEWYPHLNWMFSYFAIGCFIMRHIDMKRLMNNHLYSICFIYFIASFAFPKFSFSFNRLCLNFTSLSAIYCCFYLFIEYFKNEKVINYLKTIGNRTLDIYIIHFFFVIQIIQVGDYFIYLSHMSHFGYVTCFVLQLTYSIFISLIVITLSLYTSKLIRTSKILTIFLLGNKNYH